MIRDDTDFENALEEAFALFEHPLHPGGPEDRRLGDLLADLAAYQPSPQAPAPDDPDAERAARLAAQAEALQRHARSGGHSEALMNAVDGAVASLIRPLGGGA